MEQGRVNEPPYMPRHPPNISRDTRLQHLATGNRKGGRAQRAKTQRSSAWQTWTVLASLLSHDAVAVHGMQLDLRSWKALVTQRARHMISSCRTAIRHSPASIFISTSLKKRRKKLARQLIVLCLFFLLGAELRAVW